METDEGDAVRAAWESARRVWHPVDVSLERFRAYVSDRLPASGALAQLNTSDLYLACACVERVDGALPMIMKTFEHDLRAIVRRTGSRQGYDDVSQMLIERVLLGGADSPSRLKLYSGRGKLRYWLRVVATRLLLDDERRNTVAQHLDADVELGIVAAPDDPPELLLLRQRYRDRFQAALTSAFAALDARERLLLRYRFVDAVPVETIASIFGITRRTMSRWIKDARQKLLWDLRDRLVAELELPRGELDSLMKLLRSQLHLSLRLLV